MAPAGYSGTPLAKKLGIKPGTRILVIDAPKGYAVMVAPLPKGVVIEKNAKPGAAAMVHLFVESLSALETKLPLARRAMMQDGALWVSWYKKSAKIKTDVGEDEIRALALKTDLVDVKVCAVTEIWSG